jgi:VanZ family protein
MLIFKSLSWITVILWMAFIFNLSSQEVEKSNQLSTGVTEVIVETIEKVAPNADLDMKSINHKVRKNAHFFAYLVLGILVMNVIRRSGVHVYKSIVLATAVCVIYAISDEIHQLFAPCRGGQVKDIIIDSAGVIAGIGIYLTMSRIIKRKQKHLVLSRLLI